MSLRLSAALLSLVVGITAQLAAAQTASLTGRVLDQSGAVIAGAGVNLRGNSATRTTRSGPDGAYSFMDLAPGSYSLSASAPQFATTAPRSLMLMPGSNQLDFELHVMLETQHA